MTSKVADRIDPFHSKASIKGRKQKRSQGSSHYRSKGPAELQALPQLKGSYWLFTGCRDKIRLCLVWRIYMYITLSTLYHMNMRLQYSRIYRPNCVNLYWKHHLMRSHTLIRRNVAVLFWHDPMCSARFVIFVSE